MVNKLTGKTGKRVVVPLNPIALGIAEKHQFQIAGRITYEQEFNELIKEICKEAGLNQLFRKVFTVNGVRQEDVFQKWEVISSHTCRRSFCTNLFKKGMNLEDITLFSGHSAARILKIYIKLTPEEKVLNFLDYFR
jgi:site-specific recombinase XerD